MIFGDHVKPAATIASARWIEDACIGVPWTVGALVPNHYPLYLRVYPPDAGSEDWWVAYRHLFERIALIGYRHTATPDRAWFGVWEGHGFMNRSNEAILRQVPHFELPNRSYYLLAGPVSAVSQLKDPGAEDRWMNPDLFWPDDHRWFVATDVDFWSIYIGGDDDFITELASDLPTPTEVISLDSQLEAEN